MSLMMAVEQQSPDIAQGVWVDHDQDNYGAGDQVCLSLLLIPPLLACKNCCYVFTSNRA